MARSGSLGAHRDRRRARGHRAFLLASACALVLRGAQPLRVRGLFRLGVHATVHLLVLATLGRLGRKRELPPEGSVASNDPTASVTQHRAAGGGLGGPLVAAPSAVRADLQRRLPLALGVVTVILALAVSTPGASLAKFSGNRPGSGNQWSGGNVALGSVTSVQSCALSSVQPGTTTASANLGQALTAGTTYTSLLVNSVSKAIASGDSLMIGQGNAVQTVTATGAVSVSSLPTSVPVNSFTASTGIPAAGGMVIDLNNPNTPCSFTFSTSAGTLSSYVAADIAVVGGSTGHSALWDGTSGGLQLAIRDGAAPSDAFNVPTSTTPCGSLNSEFIPATGAVACGQILDDLLSTSATPASSTFTLYVNWALDAAVAPSYAGGTAQVLVAFHSVQSGNNARSCSTTAAIGQPCLPSGSFLWG
jgi:hypothetical protein